MSSVRLSLVIAATVPFIILGVVLWQKFQGPSVNVNGPLDGLNRIFRENHRYQGHRSFNNDAREAERFGEQNEFTNRSGSYLHWCRFTEPLFFLLMNIAAISICCASQMINQYLCRWDLMAFMEYLFSCHVFCYAVLHCILWCIPVPIFLPKRIRSGDEYDTGYSG